MIGVLAACLNGALWPLSNVYTMLTADPASAAPADTAGKFSGAPLRPFKTASEWLIDLAGQLPKVAIAICAWPRHRC